MAAWDINTYINYFKTVAQNHKSLLHVDGSKTAFFRVDIEDLLIGQIQDHKDYALYLENPEIKFNDQSNSDNPRELFMCAFMIVKPITTPNDIDAIKTVLHESHQIGKDILKKILKDLRNRVLSNVNINDWAFNKVGPIAEGLYGYRCVLVFDQPALLKWENTNWNNEDTLNI